jgi:hypothetical protein
MYFLRLPALFLLLPLVTASCAGLKLPAKAQTQAVIIIDIAMSTPGLWRMPAELSIRDKDSNEIITGKFAGFRGLTIFTNVKPGVFAIHSISSSTLEYSPDAMNPKVSVRPDLNQIRYHILEFTEGAASFTINRSGLHYLGRYEATARESYSTGNESYYDLITLKRAAPSEEREGLDYIKNAVLKSEGWSLDDIIYNPDN